MRAKMERIEQQRRDLFAEGEMLGLAGETLEEMAFLAKTRYDELLVQELKRVQEAEDFLGGIKESGSLS